MDFGAMLANDAMYDDPGQYDHDDGKMSASEAMYTERGQRELQERCRRQRMAANRGASRTQQKQSRADKIKRNKFYVGAEGALDRNWGHPTLPKAINHAEQLMDEQGRDEMFVVQIIRVVRRRKAPVEVERV